MLSVSPTYGGVLVGDRRGGGPCHRRCGYEPGYGDQSAGWSSGAGLSLLFPSLALIVINRAYESQRGAALGAITSFWHVGIAVGAPKSGLIASLTNYTDIYFVMAACAVCSACLAAPGLPRVGRRTKPILPMLGK